MDHRSSKLQKLSVRVRRSRALGDETEIGACEVDVKYNDLWRKDERPIDRHTTTARSATRRARWTSGST